MNKYRGDGVTDGGRAVCGGERDDDPIHEHVNQNSVSHARYDGALREEREFSACQVKDGCCRERDQKVNCPAKKGRAGSALEGIRAEQSRCDTPQDSEGGDSAQSPDDEGGGNVHDSAD